VKTQWEFVDDRTPFRFRVAGELVDDGFFFGLYGPVESGPSRYQNSICNIMLRFDNSDWHHPFANGDYIVEIEIEQGTSAIDGRRHELYARNELCGLELMPAYVLGATSAVAALIALPCRSVRYWRMS